ncbi:MAG: hypothetical protein LUH14_04525, partial [Clostridiaceae bacterium]|nr:hypothetical protein [Clostridiaceae bacterium]
MEENRENGKKEYTGEYGNAVDGEYTEQSSSVYSYSYKSGSGESTHSGDYYGDRNHASQQETDGSQSGNAWNSAQQNAGSQSGNAWNS